jgi:subtilisin family serine protease
LPEQALNGIGRNPHVTLVEDDPVRELHAQTIPYGINAVQAPAAITAGGTGAGIIVGVIDSGVFAAHTDLPGGVSGKIRGQPDLGFSNQQTWYRDRDSHGTHVVGTIAAVNNTEGVVGVAPGVGGIYMVKVFGDTGQWIYSSTLLAAVQAAVQNGPARVINMSLGGGVKSKSEENGMKNLYNNSGVLLIASAGNAGNTQTSYPAGYASVMSVAAVDSAKALASFSQRNSTVEIAAPGVGVLSTVSYRNGALTVDGTNFISSALEGSMQGSVSGALANGGRTGIGTWAGKVVLVERGDISFADKVANVTASGGAAAVIYNNAPGGFAGTLAPSTSSIPAISITQEDGQFLIANKLGANAAVSSVATLDTNGYDYFDGTSMSAPHVSGVAALIWSKYPQATNAQVRQALIESAEDLGTAGRDNSFGHGLVRANNALTRLGEILGGGNPPPPPEDLEIRNLTATVLSKGKPGRFTVSFTTNKTATGTFTTLPEAGNYSATGTSFSHTFQGSRGTTYRIDVTATAGTGADMEVEFTSIDVTP